MIERGTQLSDEYNMWYDNIVSTSFLEYTVAQGVLDVGAFKNKPYL